MGGYIFQFVGTFSSVCVQRRSAFGFIEWEVMDTERDRETMCSVTFSSMCVCKSKLID